MPDDLESRPLTPEDFRTQEEFSRFLELAKKEVDAWPQWKKDLFSNESST